MQKYRLAIFDLDGTLLNTVGGLANACNKVLEKHKHPTHTTSDYICMLGSGASKLIENALPKEERNPGYIEKLKEDFFEIYKNDIYYATEAYNGINELLIKLQAAGILLAVASNKFHTGVVTLINNLFPEIAFAAVFGTSDVMPNKPNTKMIDTIMMITEKGKAETIYFGDSDIDMLTGKNAAITTIGVTWGYRPKQILIDTGADEIIDNVEDILKFFEL